MLIDIMGFIHSDIDELIARIKLLNKYEFISANNIEKDVFLKIYKKYTLKTQYNFNKYVEEFNKLVSESLDNALDKYKDSNKDIIIYGRPYSTLMRNRTYFLNTKYSDYYKMYHLKVLDILSNNESDIRKLLSNNNINPAMVNEILQFKYDIPYGMFHMNDMDYRTDQHKRTQILSQNEIYKKLCK